ncbi:unnamed protein product, partial [Prorocentrum cordatum]
RAALRPPAGEAAAAGEAPALRAAVVGALWRAARSGSAGFTAGVCQVVAFMWLRTAMNYQYKNGGSLRHALTALWAEGGLPRLYRGLLPWGLAQAPLARFGDTAANEGVLAMPEANQGAALTRAVEPRVGFAQRSTHPARREGRCVRGACVPGLPVGAVTLLGSLAASSWRVAITPIQEVKAGGVAVLWYGWEGNLVANIVGGYPWFVTVNALSAAVPEPPGFWAARVRHALIGAVAATVSDLASNSIRVLKTQKQTSQDPSAGYLQAARAVIARDGVRGLFLRGLETRICTNVLQGAFFTVLSLPHPPFLPRRRNHGFERTTWRRVPLPCSIGALRRQAGRHWLHDPGGSELGSHAPDPRVRYPPPLRRPFVLSPVLPSSHPWRLCCDGPRRRCLGRSCLGHAWAVPCSRPPFRLPAPPLIPPLSLALSLSLISLPPDVSASLLFIPPPHPTTRCLSLPSPSRPLLPLPGPSHLCFTCPRPLPPRRALMGDGHGGRAPQRSAHDSGVRFAPPLVRLPPALPPISDGRGSTCGGR